MFYAQVGTDVTVIEYADQILPGTDPELVKVVQRKAKKAGMKIHVSAAAKGWKDAEKGVDVEVEIKGKAQSFKGDCILLTTGRKPATKDMGLTEVGVTMDERGFIGVDGFSKTSVDHIYAIGDATHGPMLAHKGSAQGLVAAAAIAGQRALQQPKRRAGRNAAADVFLLVPLLKIQPRRRRQVRRQMPEP